MMKKEPNYCQIYKDIIQDKFPEKKSLFNILNSKKTFSAMEIIELNNKIFTNNKNRILENNKFKAYQNHDINAILEYQKNTGLNNSQLAKHFNVSRNSVCKWKKLEILL